ncbi:hypothetical protein D3C80_987170 [compost metagenome]
MRQGQLQILDVGLFTKGRHEGAVQFDPAARIDQVAPQEDAVRRMPRLAEKLEVVFIEIGAPAHRPGRIERRLTLPGREEAVARRGIGIEPQLPGHEEGLPQTFRLDVVNRNVAGAEAGQTHRAGLQRIERPANLHVIGRLAFRQDDEHLSQTRHAAVLGTHLERRGRAAHVRRIGHRHAITNGHVSADRAIRRPAAIGGHGIGRFVADRQGQQPGGVSNAQMLQRVRNALHIAGHQRQPQQRLSGLGLKPLHDHLDLDLIDQALGVGRRRPQGHAQIRRIRHGDAARAQRQQGSRTNRTPDAHATLPELAHQASINPRPSTHREKGQGKENEKIT